VDVTRGARNRVAVAGALLIAILSMPAVAGAATPADCPTDSTTSSSVADTTAAPTTSATTAVTTAVTTATTTPVLDTTVVPTTATNVSGAGTGPNGLPITRWAGGALARRPLAQVTECPSPVVPEAPMGVLLSIVAVGVGAVVIVARRRFARGLAT
jgi:hypothetical protein